jgi:hypothetical protein
MKKTKLDSMFDEAMDFINKYAADNKAPVEIPSPEFLVHKSSDGTKYSIDGKHPDYPKMSDYHLSKTISFYRRHNHSSSIPRYLNELENRTSRRMSTKKN